MKIIELFEVEDDDFDYDYIIDIIENECGEMLEAYRSSRKVLYRGAKDLRMVFTKRTIRQDRKPVEMGAKAHELLNKTMAKLDLPTRGNSLFVSADRKIAREWGSLHVVFIPDGWKCLVYDGISSDSYSFDSLEGKAYGISRSYSGEEQIEKMSAIIKALEPKVVTTAEALEEVLDNETADVLIHGQNYYAISLENKFATRTFEIAKRLGIKL